ncbi:MAG: ParB/RepB/Spo0J family partition protein [Leptolyngbya sp. SIOISBB]|nr:ParB/RepB/Spo0J family partition protein [Leptolyngbya sp. SIOISBB]
MARKALPKKTHFGNLSSEQGGEDTLNYMMQGVQALGGNDNAAAIWVEIDKIEPWEHQPRHYFDEEKLQELAVSFKKTGFRGVLNVRPLGQGQYQIVAGERRWRAAMIAGLDKVRCLVDDCTDEEALQFGLVENLIREDLSKLEETQGLVDLMAVRLGFSPDQVIHIIRTEGHSDARRNVSPSEHLSAIIEILNSFGIDLETFRTKWLRTLELPEDLKQAHLKDKLSYNKALLLSRIANKKQREALTAQTITENLSFRDLTAEVKRLLAGREKEKPEPLVKRIKKVTRDIQLNKIPKTGEKRKQIETLLEQLEQVVDSL